MAYETDEPLDKAALVEEIVKRHKCAAQDLSDWKTEARNCYAFRCGDQWTEEDEAKLKELKRPAITFNRVGAMVDAVHGLEVNNRMEVRYLPREEGDSQVNENLTSAGKWVRDECYAEDEESEAFEDATICGVGCTETRMDYEDDPDGKIIIERRDPIRLLWDATARKKCLEDAKFVFHDEWMHKDEVKSRWPDKWEDITGDFVDLERDGTPHDADRAFLYREEASHAGEKRGDYLLVSHYQCWKLEKFYRAVDPFSQKLVSLDEKQFSSLKTKLAPLGMSFFESGGEAGAPGAIPYVEQKRKTYYQGFLVGRTLLQYGRLPVDEQTGREPSGFTFRFITGRRDRNKNCWYGIVRDLMDPQRWGNKILTMSVDILASNIKGGVTFETGAFVDKRKAEETWAAHSPFIELNEGMMDKVKPREPSPYPAGFDRLMNFAFNALPFVSGINLEAMGLADRAQAGILEQTRKQSAISLLAPLFDSLRRYRKSQGRLMLAFITKYLTQNRLIRIIGQAGDPKYLPLIADPDTARYDVVVDQAPSSPDYKQKVWEALKELLPVMIKQGYPLPPAVFEYTPLPTHVAKQMQAYAQGFIPPAIQAQMQQMKKQMQAMAERDQQTTQVLRELQADKSADMAKVQAHVFDIIKRRERDAEKAATEITIAKIGAMGEVADRMHASGEASKDRSHEAIQGELDRRHERQVADMKGTGTNG